MNRKVRRIIANRKRKIERRLARKDKRPNPTPVFRGKPTYEVAQRLRGVGVGGIGMVQNFVHAVGLDCAIDRRLELLKVHLPYHESDHVLNIAYNALSGGTCLDDIEVLRTDEAYLDLLGAERIPDPTTAGDFCRRFADADVLELQNAYDETRLKVWARQPDEFFEEAIIDMDGTMVTTWGECKEGMDINYKGQWGYHPLLVSLANTGEPLRLINRAGSRPSHEGAWAAADDAIDLCRRGGFRRVLLRGDTDFTQTERLDDWDAQGNVRFVFGIDAMANLVDLAEELPQIAWVPLVRREKRPCEGEPRSRPENVKEQAVRQRGFRNLRLRGEEVAEFSYRPGACERDYRVVVVHKIIEEERGGVPLIDGAHDRYFFYITNDLEIAAEQVVFLANDRCNQENLIEQLKNGVPALHAPVDDLTSNWAYMTMASLAWNLKAWLALGLPEQPGRWVERRRSEKRTVLKMEFKKFANHFIRVPAQVVRTGRRLVCRLLAWGPWQSVFFRMVDAAQLLTPRRTSGPGSPDRPAVRRRKGP